MLQTLIERSALLTDGQKRWLLSALTALDDAQKAELEELMQQEQQIIMEEMAERGNTQFFDALDAILRKGESGIRKGEEGAEHAGEQQAAENLFNDVP